MELNQPDWTTDTNPAWKPTPVTCKLCNCGIGDTAANQDPYQVWLRHAAIRHPEALSSDNGVEGQTEPLPKDAQ